MQNDSIYAGLSFTYTQFAMAAIAVALLFSGHNLNLQYLLGTPHLPLGGFHSLADTETMEVLVPSGHAVMVVVVGHQSAAG